jgi:hypothetical protein
MFNDVQDVLLTNNGATVPITIVINANKLKH